MVFQKHDLTIAEMHQEIVRLGGILNQIHDWATNRDVSEETAIMEIRDLTADAFSAANTRSHGATHD
jgi:hypothetical protein